MFSSIFKFLRKTSVQVISVNIYVFQSYFLGVRNNGKCSFVQSYQFCREGAAQASIPPSQSVFIVASEANHLIDRSMSGLCAISVSVHIWEVRNCFM